MGTAAKVVWAELHTRGGPGRRSADFARKDSTGKGSISLKNSRNAIYKFKKFKKSNIKPPNLYFKIIYYGENL